MPGVTVVPIEQVLAARVRGAAELFEKGRELGVGDRAPVDPEGLQRDGMRRTLVGGTVVAAHDEGAARNTDHAGFGRVRGGHDPDCHRDEGLAESSGRVHVTILPRLLAKANHVVGDLLQRIGDPGPTVAFCGDDE